ncbi:unnamed protein product [Rangifer tarandus platyrhynchus]|uniref:Uncharacterized protein n=1 Tax=Rangifer tarandus platyrhynchus TaxID=3082113 RepID=A0ABN8XJI6_RANTA|nr:unnamed protein product [Rangifer tarandus platyrhynchus]
MGGEPTSVTTTKEEDQIFVDSSCASTAEQNDPRKPHWYADRLHEWRGLRRVEKADPASKLWPLLPLLLLFVRSTDKKEAAGRERLGSETSRVHCFDATRRTRCEHRYISFFVVGFSVARRRRLKRYGRSLCLRAVVHDVLFQMGAAWSKGAFEAAAIPRNFGEIRMKDITGRERSLSEWDGKCGGRPSTWYSQVKLIVNVASKCGLTKASTAGLIELRERYGTGSVRARQQEVTSLQLKNIGWNYGKFLLDKENGVYKYYGPRVEAIKLAEDIGKLISGEKDDLDRRLHLTRRAAVNGALPSCRAVYSWTAAVALVDRMGQASDVKRVRGYSDYSANDEARFRHTLHVLFGGLLRKPALFGIRQTLEIVFQAGTRAVVGPVLQPAAVVLFTETLPQYPTEVPQFALVGCRKHAGKKFPSSDALRQKDMMRIGRIRSMSTTISRNAVFSRLRSVTGSWIQCCKRRS